VDVLLDRYGWTQVDLGKRMARFGYTATGNGTINNLLRGRRRSARARLAMARALGIDPADLMLMTPVTGADGEAA
jgi:hypothetical protein